MDTHTAAVEVPPPLLLLLKVTPTFTWRQARCTAARQELLTHIDPWDHRPLGPRDCQEQRLQGPETSRTRLFQQQRLQGPEISRTILFQQQRLQGQTSWTRQFQQQRLQGQETSRTRLFQQQRFLGPETARTRDLPDQIVPATETPGKEITWNKPPPIPRPSKDGSEPGITRNWGSRDQQVTGDKRAPGTKTLGTTICRYIIILCMCVCHVSIVIAIISVSKSCQVFQPI